MNIVCGASSALEREMLARQSREELIKRGVLKEIFEKGEHVDTHTATCPPDRSGFDRFRLVFDD